VSLGPGPTNGPQSPEGDRAEMMRATLGTPQNRGVEAAAAADPDARPMTPEETAKARRVPRIKSLRRALGLTRKNSRRGITFRSAPCATGSRDTLNRINRRRPYLKVIASNEGTSRTLAKGSAHNIAVGSRASAQFGTLAASTLYFQRRGPRRLTPQPRLNASARH
jgi:putative transcriptional regulator